MVIAIEAAAAMVQGTSLGNTGIATAGHAHVVGILRAVGLHTTAQHRPPLVNCPTRGAQLAHMVVKVLPLTAQHTPAYTQVL